MVHIDLFFIFRSYLIDQMSRVWEYRVWSARPVNNLTRWRRTQIDTTGRRVPSDFYWR